MLIKAARQTARARKSQQLQRVDARAMSSSASAASRRRSCVRFPPDPEALRGPAPSCPGDLSPARDGRRGAEVVGAALDPSLCLPRHAFELSAAAAGPRPGPDAREPASSRRRRCARAGGRPKGGDALGSAARSGGAVGSRVASGTASRRGRSPRVVPRTGAGEPEEVEAFPESVPLDESADGGCARGGHGRRARGGRRACGEGAAARARGPCGGPTRAARKKPGWLKR